MKFKATTFGDYQFKYTDKTSRVIACSNVISVGPEFRLSVTKVEELKYSVKYAQISGNQYPSAWIGLYPKTELNNHQYSSYQWLSNSVNLSLTFEIPKVGDWEFRLFPLRNLLGPYLHVSSAPLKLEGSDELELSIKEDGSLGQAIIHYNIVTVDPERDSVWIGLFVKQETNNRQFRRYKNITTCNESRGVISFKKPIHGGIYEARLFALRTYQPIATSNSVLVEGI